jgi:hypothetical protein
MLTAAVFALWSFWIVIYPEIAHYLYSPVFMLVISMKKYRWTVVLWAGAQLGMDAMRGPLLRSPLGTVLYCGFAALLFCLFLWALALDGMFRDPNPTRKDTTGPDASGPDTSVADSPSDGGMAP